MIVSDSTALALWGKQHRLHLRTCLSRTYFAIAVAAIESPRLLLGSLSILRAEEDVLCSKEKVPAAYIVNALDG